jgi:hypothetical protein
MSNLITFDESTGGGSFRKPNFLKLKNLHVVRILSTKGHKTYVHWINNLPIECLNEDCPICSNNQVIIAENPNNFRNISDYHSRNQIFYLNVLDRTPTKICPNCDHENTIIGNRFPPVCEQCGNLLSEVESAPVNKVKILTRGKTFGEDLNSIHANNIDADGQPIGIQNYDIQIMVGANKQPFAQPLLHNDDKVDVPEAELFDLETAPVTLDASQMLDFRRGISLRDIFAAGRNEEETMEFPPKGLEDNLVSEISDKAEQLIG